MNMHKFSLNMQDKHNYVQIIIDYAENPGVISSVTDCYHPTNPRSFRTHYSIADTEWISKHSLHVNHLPCDRLENFSAYYWTPRSTPTRARAYRGVSLKTWWLPPRHCQGISTGQENGHRWLRKHMIGRKHVGPRQAVRSSRDSHRLLTRQTVRSSSLFRYVRVNGRTWGQRRPRGLASGSIFEYCVTGTTPRHRPTTSFTPPATASIGPLRRPPPPPPSTVWQLLYISGCCFLPNQVPAAFCPASSSCLFLLMSLAIRLSIRPCNWWSFSRTSFSKGLNFELNDFPDPDFRGEAMSLCFMLIFASILCQLSDEKFAHFLQIRWHHGLFSCLKKLLLAIVSLNSLLHPFCSSVQINFDLLNDLYLRDWMSSTSDDEHSSFGNLPDHLLIEIFDRVPVSEWAAISCVNKRWADLFRQERLWQAALSRSYPFASHTKRWPRPIPRGLSKR